ncbi:MAG: DUF1761 domain-containing protein [Saprospiraceae bacterium]|nr:DUF1761 domain-containing protein [Saprospiraceae bacterium]
MKTKTNWLALLTTLVVNMGLGMLWYGKLFNAQWMSGNGISLAGDKMMKNGVEMPMSNLPMITNVVSLLVFSFLINWLVEKTQSFTFQSGAILGGVIGLINFFGIYTGNRFAGNPTSLSMVDGSYTLLLFVIMGAIIGGWRK